jgi:hypothetical protein
MQPYATVGDRPPEVAFRRAVDRIAAREEKIGYGIGAES